MPSNAQNAEHKIVMKLPTEEIGNITLGFMGVQNMQSRKFRVSIFNDQISQLRFFTAF